MSDILELIDNAVADYTSDDAMRWTPEPPPKPRPLMPDPEAFQAAMAEVSRQMAERVKPFLEAFAVLARQLAPVIAQMNIHLKGLEPTLRAIESDRRERVSGMHAAYRRRRR